MKTVAMLINRSEATKKVMVFEKLVNLSDITPTMRKLNSMGITVVGIEPINYDLEKYKE